MKYKRERGGEKERGRERGKFSNRSFLLRELEQRKNKV